ncbi:unnamed protein product [Didymodactylos carnosus]|uniref:Uncharacterized protein n=1 Tax=Didymodactylos carnosus TaxID=1234261 RepID=A0A813SJC2_9BILA|nr:unnamed protein product [Didymodactylos carnosus]CAF0801426.1 unnamed protein product [Didymodactylos carnosus]CAF3506516.1 unnamed protein product [Didymodactylos carnosus]CAF3586449.1 unnamed protein product [Didymodactylos carnosus]
MLTSDLSITLELKRQLDFARFVIEQSNHAERCQFIERLLPSCSVAQIDFLWSVLQQTLHRDYYYSVMNNYPNYHFKRISTPVSRVLKEIHKRPYDRDESFYLSSTNDLRQFQEEGTIQPPHSSFAQSINSTGICTNKGI